MTSADATAAGDRRWSDAAGTRIAALTEEVRDRAAEIQDGVEVDPVHDMRTATRRLRTALRIYADQVDRKARKRDEAVLKRLAQRLGTIRDLDVLLAALDNATADGSGRIPADDLAPLRRAWHAEREEGATRLLREIGRRRVRRMLAAESPTSSPDEAPPDGPAQGTTVERVAGRAPALIWDALGKVLAFELDPLTADPAEIHRLRIAAKKLRYTLEAFEDALVPGTSLIDQVRAVHDGGGDMHDAIVARDRARELLRKNPGLHDRERLAIEGFAEGQDQRATSLRPIIARALATIRARAFRESLGRAAAAMGTTGGRRRDR